MTNTTTIQSGNVAIVTGAASGIGLAAATHLAALGMKIGLVDLPGPRLDAALREVQLLGDAQAFAADVSQEASVAELERSVHARLGAVSLLWANAGIQPGSTMFGAQENWRRVIEVNLWGVIHCARIFAPQMMAAGQPATILITGSKQGITTPPGDPAYNVSKAAVKAFAEALQHDLRNTSGSQVSAHLVIPGFVWTPLTYQGRAEKPAGAWTSEQTVTFVMDSWKRGDFYILCPDNDVNRELDERRIAWAAGDIINNRPPLSRWHADFGEAFAEYLKP